MSESRRRERDYRDREDRYEKDDKKRVRDDKVREERKSDKREDEKRREEKRPGERDEKRRDDDKRRGDDERRRERDSRRERDEERRREERKKDKEREEKRRKEEEERKQKEEREKKIKEKQSVFGSLFAAGKDKSLTTSASGLPKVVFVPKKKRDVEKELNEKKEEEAKKKEKREAEKKFQKFKELGREQTWRNRDSERDRYDRREKKEKGKEAHGKAECEVVARMLVVVSGESIGLTEKELTDLKASILGGTKRVKRKYKAAERIRFVADWKDEDDTYEDSNPLYNKRLEPSLMFGRGKRAGIDAKVQMSEFYRELTERRGGLKVEKSTKVNKADLHWTEKDLEDMTVRDWRIFKEDFNIHVSSNTSESINPMRSWNESNLHPKLLSAIERIGYKKPFPIQMAAVPIGLQMRDLIGVANTGSGKTAAFLLPMLSFISQLKPITPETASEGPYAIILAPTRELIQQIEAECIKFCGEFGFRTLSIYGGKDIQAQGFKFTQGVEIIIATPGRLIDCLERSYVVLNQCTYVVLDEADRMIDDGYEPAVKEILSNLPVGNEKPADPETRLLDGKLYRNTAMFSATMPPAVERIAKTYLRNPIMIKVGKPEGETSHTVTQTCLWTPESGKRDLLIRTLRAEGKDRRIMVFVNLKKQADVVMRNIEREGFYTDVIHGSKSQDEREASLKAFRDDEIKILVATDVAGRGIDVPDVELVICYDLPAHIEPYTHRIGRTGRAGKTGRAISFCTPDDTEVMYDFKQTLIAAGARVPHELAQHEASKVRGGVVADGPPGMSDSAIIN